MKNNLSKVKVKTDKSGETIVDYGKVSEPLGFRGNLLSRLLYDTATDATLVIDTNLRIPSADETFDELAFKVLGLNFTVLPVKLEPVMFFGVKMNKQLLEKTRWTEKKIIIELAHETDIRQLIEMIGYYDLSIGFGRKVSFEEICQIYRAGGEELIFNASFFADSLYDSVICARLRSTLGLERYVEAIKNEMAL